MRGGGGAEPGARAWPDGGRDTTGLVAVRGAAELWAARAAGPAVRRERQRLGRLADPRPLPPLREVLRAGPSAGCASAKAPRDRVSGGNVREAVSVARSAAASGAGGDALCDFELGRPQSRRRRAAAPKPPDSAPDSAESRRRPPRYREDPRGRRGCAARRRRPGQTCLQRRAAAAERAAGRAAETWGRSR